MCIRDRLGGLWHGASWNFVFWGGIHGVALAIDKFFIRLKLCLLYTSDAADDLLCVGLGGRRIIKKKK